MSTATADAFKSDGNQQSQDDDALMQIAIDAWKKFPRDDQRVARRECVAEHLNNNLLWPLMKMRRFGVVIEEIVWLLNRAKESMKTRKSNTGLRPVDSRGQNDAKTHSVGSPAVTNSNTDQRSVGTRGHRDVETQEGHSASATSSQVTGSDPVSGGGQSLYETQSRFSPAAPISQDAATSDPKRQSEPAKAYTKPKWVMPVAQREKHDRTIAAHMRVLESLSRLDTFLILGKPIGDCTVAEVREWAAMRNREAKAAQRDVVFAMNLAANLPSNRVIRDAWTNPVEVNKLYDRVENEYAA